MTRAALIISLALVPLAARGQMRYALGTFQPGPLCVYEISASGEISLKQQTVETSTFGDAAMDSAGRMVITERVARIQLFRIAHDRTVALASSVEAEPGSGFAGSAGLSQDGRVLLVMHVDTTVTPFQSEFRTYFVTNRLQLRATGHALNAESLRGIAFWTISDRRQYTAIVNLAPSPEFAILHVSPSGEIADTGQRVMTPVGHNVPFDVSSDGRWILTGHQGGSPDVTLYEALTDGTVLLRQSAEFASSESPWSVRLWPNLQGLAIASTPGLLTAGLDAGVSIGPPLDLKTPSFGLTFPVAISPDSGMVLVGDQAPGFTFPIYSYFMSETGELTPTGYSLPLPDNMFDLRFLPDPPPVTLAGDANVDNVVDAADIVFLVNEAMPDDKPILYPQNFANADLDQDVDVDQDDLEALVQLLVGE